VSSRLRVGVTALLSLYPSDSGVGIMWRNVLAELGDGFDARGLEPGSLRARLWRPQVWAQDGHQGPLAVRAPVVAQLHEAAWADPDTRAALDPAFIDLYEESSRAAARQAARIVTPSESSARQITEAYGVPSDRIVVAPHGVDHSVFRPDASGGSDVVARAGGDPGRPYVLFVSQLHPRKNLGALRDAMTRLAARGFPHSLVIVGRPPMDRPDAAEVARDATADLPGTEGRVVHLEGISDAELAAVMAGAAAFCLPSFMEGFGLTALEAMACGTPVVVSDRGALQEVVAGAGAVVHPTPEAVEDALAGVLSDDDRARALARAGHERSREFTWAATARHWARAFREAVSSA
jgi:glycosyltransferase involved in cell wall biosynthesis